MTAPPLRCQACGAPQLQLVTRCTVTVRSGRLTGLARDADTGAWRAACASPWPVRGAAPGAPAYGPPTTDVVCAACGAAGPPEGLGEFG